MEYALKIIRLPKFGLGVLSQQGAALLWHLHDHVIPHPRNNYFPHVFKKTTVGLLSLLLVSFKLFTIAAVSFGPVMPAFSSAINAENIITLTNRSRQQFRLSALKRSAQLDLAAQTKAQDMLEKGYFSHNAPDGKTPWNFINSAGYNYLAAGENLAVNFTESEQVEQAWMDSPGHKANILNKNYEEIGVGMAQGQYQGHAAIFVVQMFGTPIEEKIVLTGEPTVVQKEAVPAPEPVAVAAAENFEPAPAQQKAMVQSTDVLTEQGNLKITARALPQTVKVIATFGEKAIMLNPKAEGQWEGGVPLSHMPQQVTRVEITAFDMAGNKDEKFALAIAPDMERNYQVLGAVSGVNISIWNKIFDLNNLNDKFYAIFISAMLASLLLAMSIRRHVQHLELIANGSFVVILAAIIWMAG